ncbi:EsV-1-85 [Ectocarpus siliculosus]|uniref:EsV-1-85 n=1 Tax=Ectocarpus siliculosus TaxID=2880 RepID=D8LPB6_ECTSI|nr:EsV-1-85 [Ectocarpus siliculosus]|eukprot:CBN80387.1 EsV-1-85 [Ectocarpus siliculosus]
MDFLSNVVTSTFGNGLLQAGTAVATGKSAGDVAKHAMARNQTRRLEEYFMKAAEAYSSGYSTFLALNTAKFGAAAIVALVAWTTTYLMAQRRNRNRDLGEVVDQPSNATAVAGSAAFFAAFVAVLVFDVVRRQRTLSNFTGTNMFMQYAMFFCVPLGLFSAGLKLASPLDLQTSVAAAAVIAVAVVVVAKKLYFVFMENDLERKVFTEIANALDACPGPGKAGCNHKHAGYLDAFANMVKPYLDQINFILPNTLDAAEVARDIASRQKFDTLRNQV